MDAIELLEQQHREVETLFGRIEQAEGEEKQEQFELLADALAVHAAIEEKFFYPATKAARSEGQLSEAVEEHLSMKRFLAELLDSSPEDDSFDARLDGLKELVGHHVADEEADLFPAARELLSTDELDDLGVVMEDAAKEMERVGPRESIPAGNGATAPFE